MRNFIISAEGISNKGLVRNHNEDHVLFGDIVFTDDYVKRSFLVKDNPVFAVADGLGGHRAGEVASREVLEHLKDFTENLPPDAKIATLREPDIATLREQFTGWVTGVHQHLVHLGNKNPAFTGMGTTVCGLLFLNDKVIWIHAGDSRLYHFSGGELARVTEDHSQAALMNDPRIPSNMIANCIGAGPAPYIEVGEISSIAEGDVLLLCSDGLSDMLDDHRIASLIASKDVRALAEAANESGGIDNISVIRLVFTV